MKLQIVPPSRGALWVRRGFDVFFTRPLAFFSLCGTLLLGMLLARLLPWVGPLLLLACLPWLTLGFMLATQQVLRGHPLGPQILTAPLRGDRSRAAALVQLGIFYAISMVLVAMVRVWIDGGRSEALQAAMVSGKATSENLAIVLADARLQLGLFWFAAMATLLGLPFWHAPALLYWGGQSVAKAMFFSAVACWRNKGAFLVYGATWVGAIVAFILASSILFVALGQVQWIGLVVMSGLLVFTMVFYASLFFTFADCFKVTPSPLPAHEGAP